MKVYAYTLADDGYEQFVKTKSFEEALEMIKRKHPHVACTWLWEFKGYDHEETTTT